ncbi:hypothetical protein B0H13DRAFT_2354923 [Mycena leptocephala]|nr:hypothetical protein B0H13DRAFT_2354923 [Mycena leptocephala]
MSAIPSTLSFLDVSGSLGALENGTLLDSNLLKAAVGFVWILELGHTISAWHAIYSQTITFYGQPGHILSPAVSEETTIIFAALIYTVVQTFFANRVRVLSGQWYIMALACVLGLLRFVGHAGIVALLLHYSRVTIVLGGAGFVVVLLSLGYALMPVEADPDDGGHTYPVGHW